MSDKAHLFQPEDDGITHINIYTRAATDLGRQLSHFYRSPFVHPYLGPFTSMEGLWFYIRTTTDDPEREELRNLVGFKAKQFGVKFPQYRFDEFPSLIVDANYHKIVQNRRLHDLFVESELPFDHYYVHESKCGSHKFPIRKKGFKFLVEGFEELRRLLKEGKAPEPLNYHEIFTRLRNETRSK